MNLRRVLTAVFTLLGLSAALAFAVVNTPQTPAGQFFQNPSLIGCTNFQVDLSTVPVSITTSSGFLYRLCAWNGNGTTSSGYAMAFDSASVSGMGTFGSTVVIANGNGTVNAVPKATAITPPVAALPYGGTAVNSGLPGCVDLVNSPSRFNNGLVVSLSSNTVQAVGCYRLDGGTNP